MGHRRSIVDKLGVSIGWKKLYHTPGVGFHNPKRFCLALRPTVLAGKTSVLANLEKDDSSRYNGDRSKVFHFGRAGRARGRDRGGGFSWFSASVLKGFRSSTSAARSSVALGKRKMAAALKVVAEGTSAVSDPLPHHIFVRGDDDASYGRDRSQGMYC